MLPLLRSAQEADSGAAGGEACKAASGGGGGAPAPWRLLDVGAGDGLLAEGLLPLFPGGAVAVDCNNALLLGGSAATTSGGGGEGAPAPAPATPCASGGGGCGAPSVRRVVADFLDPQLDLGPAPLFHLVLASHFFYQARSRLSGRGRFELTGDQPPALLALKLRFSCDGQGSAQAVPLRSCASVQAGPSAPPLPCRCRARPLLRSCARCAPAARPAARCWSCTSRRAARCSPTSTVGEFKGWKA